MWHVYLLQSKIDYNYAYIGYTDDLRKRIDEHNSGKTKSNKYKSPFKLIYFETYCNKTTAIKREWELKHNSFKKKELFERLKFK
jgi:predicted GIY-YIG superfamily endonuclease